MISILRRLFIIAVHIISEKGFGVPGSTNEMFYLLEENEFLNRDLTEKMVKRVGFRNLPVHAYTKIDVERVYEITQEDIHDFEAYLRSMFNGLGFELKAILDVPHVPYFPKACYKKPRNCI